jgi:hypothetical protein
MVNKELDSSSESSRDSGDCRGLPKGDLHVGNFGDTVCIKKDNTLRLGFQNIGGFPSQCRKLKEDNIRLGIQKWDFDIFGMAETNLDWRVLKEHEKLPTRTKEWWDQQNVSWAHNRTFVPHQAQQYGGTALFSINKAAHQVIEKGFDQSLLGRWCWTRFKGKGNQTLRVIAYRPNPPKALSLSMPNKMPISTPLTET